MSPNAEDALKYVAAEAKNYPNYLGDAICATLVDVELDGVVQSVLLAPDPEQVALLPQLLGPIGRPAGTATSVVTR